MAQPNSHLPFHLDARDPDFARQCLIWSAQTRSEIQQIIADALIAEADRILGKQ
jgi:hypothetical protein